MWQRAAVATCRRAPRSSSCVAVRRWLSSASSSNKSSTTTARGGLGAAKKGGGLGKERIFSVDRSGLFKPRKPAARRRPLVEGQPSSLADELCMEIEVRGPMSVATYMNHCLTHPRHGYYTTREHVIGEKGDFVTSPEISQVFGELVGVWCVSTWMQMRRPRALNLIECGPGTGSLMQDVLRAAARFPAFAQALHVHLIEISAVLRERQRETLGVGPLTFVKETSTFVGKNPETGLDVTWHLSEASVPHGDFVCVAHEFFDALPVHQFEFSEEYGWCERLIDVIDEDDEIVPVSSGGGGGGGGDGDGLGLFRFVLSPGPTAAANAYLGKAKQLDPKPGDRIEVSPGTLAFGEAIARRMMRPGDQGALLAIDYGADRPFSESLQAVQNHTVVPSLLAEEPGSFDMTAHVDFASLRAVMTRVSPQIWCPPLLTQSEWLQNMGIGPRIKMLIDENPSAEEELMGQAARLLDDDVEAGGMGALFKVFAAMRIGSEGGKQPHVAGFTELS